LRNDYAYWCAEEALLRIREWFTDDPDWEIEVAVALLRDAAAVVPEIRELVAPVLHEDAALIDAEIEIRWLRDRLAEPVNPGLIKIWGEEHEAENRRKVEAALVAQIDRVAKTEAKTARGRAVKAALGFVA